MSVARYDGHADWYDHTFAGYGDLSSESSRDGARAPASTWPAVPDCISRQSNRLVNASSASTSHTISCAPLDGAPPWSHVPMSRNSLPHSDRPTVACAYLHTYTDELPAVFAEIVRMPEPGGRLV